MEDYRAIPRIANSDLTEFKNKLLFGLAPRNQPSQAMDFGIRFHDRLLINSNRKLAGKGSKQAVWMIDALEQDSDFDWCRRLGNVEKVILWHNKTYGLPCKGRLDIVLETEKTIVDIKTTSVSSQAEFVESCLSYDYDRQAAYYLDGANQAGIPMERFLFIGVQKQRPNKLFKYWSLYNDDFIQYGRRKYDRLLRSWQQEQYVPSSWNSTASH